MRTGTWRVARRLRRASPLSALASVGLVCGATAGTVQSVTVHTASAGVATHAGTVAGVAGPSVERAARVPSTLPPLPDGMRYSPSLTPSAASVPMEPAVAAGPVPEHLADPARSNEAVLTKRKTGKKPPFASTELFGISCWSKTGCMAVGTRAEEAADALFAITWNGSSWSTLATPAVTISGARVQEEFADVSCWSSSGCMAVGYSPDDEGAGFAMSWNGKSWALSLAPGSVTNGTELQGVSCTGDGFCAAVGEGSGGPLAETWDGSQWTEGSLPTLPGTQVLSGISCRVVSSSPVCVAVGLPAGAIVEYDAGTWSSVGGSTAAGQNDLDAVSCAPATGSSLTCLAVGYAQNGTSYSPLTVELSGSPPTLTSSVLKGATPGTAYSYLYGVSCPSATSCTVVGAGSSNEREELNFAETRTGSKLSVVKTATPGTEPRAVLSGISCESSTSCVAVGTQESVVEQWTDFGQSEVLTKGTFDAVPVPQFRDPGGIVAAVACGSASFCAAVGQWDPEVINTGFPMSEIWNGRRWSLASLPTMAGFGGDAAAVSCPTTSLCIVAGTLGAGVDLPVLWTTTPSGSRLIKVPQVPEDESDEGSLNAIACTSRTWCLAVGSAGGMPFSLTWNGKSFAVSLMKQYFDAATIPRGISCSSRTICFAVVRHELTELGEYGSGIERWSGSGWSTVSETVSESGSEQVELQSVACPTSTSCTAVGFRADSGSGVAADISVARRSRVTASVLPSGGSHIADVVWSIACTSESACTAVGGAVGADGEKPAIWTRKTTSWSDSEPLHVVGSLQAVWCSGSSCMAGGWSGPHPGDGEKPYLAEKSNGAWKGA